MGVGRQDPPKSIRKPVSQGMFWTCFVAILAPVQTGVKENLKLARERLAAAR